MGNNNRPNNQRPAQRRPSGRSAASQRARAEAARRRRRENIQIRVATVIGLAVLIAIIVIVIVACNGNKKNKEAAQVASGGDATVQQGKTNDNSADIPAEYVEPTYTRADIAMTDEYPVPSNDGNYIIYVNTALNVTTVYRTDEEGNRGEAVRCIPCSTAREGYETPLGDDWYLMEWIILPDNEWCYMADGTEGLYAYRITNGEIFDIMFHSVPYYSTDHGDLEWEEYNKLGSEASMGCIRMCAGDVRWLGETCAINTPVYLYSDPNEVFPISVDEPIRIPAEVEEIRGWDPTDPISSNPWHTYTIEMNVPNSVEVEQGADYAQDPILAEVKVTDQFGHDLSQYAQVMDSYDTETKGTYQVKVKAVVGPVTAEKTVYVVVK